MLGRTKSPIRLAGAIAASLALCAATAPALAADESYATVANLIDRVGRLEQRMSGPALAQMVGQSEELRSELQSLRGDLEQLGHDIEELKQQQRAQYQDLDQRIQTLAGGSAQRKPAGGDDNSAEPGQPPVDAAAAEAAQQAYQKAFDSVKEGRYKEGIGLFKNFLSSYPNDESAGNAQYWLGECYYVTRDFNGAREAFRKVLDAYPKSPKAAKAQERLQQIKKEGH